MKVQVETKTPEETTRLAERLTEIISPPAIVSLSGGLGSGKTFLVKSFVKATGSEAQTSSPTFTIINVYDSPVGVINHLDLYRLSDIDELYAIGFDDILEDPGITFIEWPEIAEPLEADYHVEIETTGDNSRFFIIEGNNPELEKLER